LSADVGKQLLLVLGTPYLDIRRNEDSSKIFCQSQCCDFEYCFQLGRVV